jgi:L-alanine-DL-glutamate epimerase-like enolase superfamily enzyme
VISIASLSAFVFRCPIAEPIRTSFGVMVDRPAVLVRATDADGNVGWGEIWCNFPTVGAEHRARLVSSILEPRLVGRDFATPEEAFKDLSAATEVLALQTGEHGPLAQSIAGVDNALWDLFARKQRTPLWRLLGGKSSRVRAYASGLNPDAPEILAKRRYGEGHRAFKLKVGFGVEKDVANLEALRRELGEGVNLMVDANQGWSFEQACAIAPKLERFHPTWLEEPLRANRPWEEWKALRSKTPIALAAGENLQGFEAFDAAIAAGALRVIQPDIGKWGGFSGCVSVARRIVAAGLVYCPHWLQGGIGLLASAHLLAATGGDGYLELDANPNPLRELIWQPRITQGTVEIGDAPGLGDLPDPLRVLEAYRR